MKTPLLLLFLAAGSLAVRAADSTQPGGDMPVSWVDPADPAVTAIRQTGERLIERVGRTLIFEVERAIADKGLAKAMETAHLKDFALPKPEPGQPRVTAIKRTSLGLRDPANRPDAADQAALDKIDTALRDGDEVPTLLMQRLDRPAAPEWRVYRPLTTMPLCIKCHGPLEDLKPEVRAFLDQRYPEDQAVGYTAYKWRGIIRVSLASPVPAPAKSKTP